MSPDAADLRELLDEHAHAQRYSLALVAGLSAADVAWRPHADSSAIGWHLGHQGAVNHYLVRNLTAASASLNTEFDRLFDSATPEPDRGELPPLADIVAYREAIAAGTRTVVGRIAAGDVGAPDQLARVAERLLCALVDHEYQHAAWIGEVRATLVDDAPPEPTSTRLTQVDGYWMLDPA